MTPQELQTLKEQYKVIPHLSGPLHLKQPPNLVIHAHIDLLIAEVELLQRLQADCEMALVGRFPKLVLSEALDRVKASRQPANQAQQKPAVRTMYGCERGDVQG